MRILVAEDDPPTANYITSSLRKAGHEVDAVASGDIALATIRQARHDIVILDRMLPMLEGLEVLKRVRADDTRIPILMLTALGQIEDRVTGLEAGADDYLVKPFAISELLARVNALSRRLASGDPPVTLSVGPIAMDLIHREVRCAGKVVGLQPRENRLLEELMRNAGRIVTRTMLLERVWNFHFDPQTNLVETHMSRLRAKLALHGVSDIIETIRGAGYRLRDHI